MRRIGLAFAVCMMACGSSTGGGNDSTGSGNALPAATPTFSPGAGTFTSAQSVVLACATPGATIHFTADGSDPGPTSTAYASPISLSTTTTLKAMATAPGYTASAIATATYVISAAVSQGPMVTPAGTPFGAASSSLVGVAGGAVESSDGKFTLIVPAGAMAAATTLSIQPITNEMTNGLWLGYRLTPSGPLFSQPATLTFHYDAFDLAGTAPAMLGIAFQDAQGGWHVVDGATVDEAQHTVAVQTTHFTDFGPMAFTGILPASANLTPGQSIQLAIQVCNTAPDPGNPGSQVLYHCDTPSTIAVPGNWAVNGQAGGNASIGTVASSGSQAWNATYTAPSSPPTPNPVAVSADWAPTTNPAARQTFVSNINIFPCPLAGQPANQCPVRFNGRTVAQIAESGGLVTYTLKASVTWSETSVTGGRLVAYAASGTVAIENIDAGGCLLTAVPSSHDFSGAGSLVIDFGATPPHWAGGASDTWTPMVSGSCTDGSTVPPTPMTVGGSFFGDTVGGDVKADGSGFSGTSTPNGGTTIDYAFTNPYRLPR